MDLAGTLFADIPDMMVHVMMCHPGKEHVCRDQLRQFSKNVEGAPAEGDITFLVRYSVNFIHH